MGTQMLPAELLLVAVFASALAAAKLIMKLVHEVGEEFQNSNRDQKQLFEYLNETSVIFKEYNERNRTGESALASSP